VTVMNQDNMMKWILVAVGVYLSWNWFKNWGVLEKMPTMDYTPGTDGTNTGAGSGTITGSTQPL
jgi:hypothetical protein